MMAIRVVGVMALVAALGMGSVACGGGGGAGEGDNTGGTDGGQRSDLSRCLDMCARIFEYAYCRQSNVGPIEIGGEAVGSEGCGRACADGKIDPAAVECVFGGEIFCSRSRWEACLN